MGLSRLENFLRSVRGNILYVDPNALDSTDSIDNDGTSAARPFKTLQRALIEAARFSYLTGFNNDKFGNTTILLYPGEHLIDNRPGWIPIDGTNYRKRDGTSSIDLLPFDLTTNFDINSDNNSLYKLNSVHGGVIVPRGTSIVGYDLRKTKIRPKYVPNPRNDVLPQSAIFRITGACYLWQMSIFDANPNGLVFQDYTNNKIVPNFSHHKLTVFEYADGVNDVVINDGFIDEDFGRTDLDIYYEKIGLVYGPATGNREITNDYPGDVDIEPKIDEYRIVGSRGAEVGITSIRSGDGFGGGNRNEITVTLESDLDGLDTDTPIRIDGVGILAFNGQYVVNTINSSNEIVFITSNPPASGFNQVSGQGTLNIVVDTVTSASPYIFNCSLRSVFGMCGMHADGNSVSGFKSMVVAQYTGISLQKDNNAFVKYDKNTGTYLDGSTYDNAATDSLSRYKPAYDNFHVKASNNALIQAVSIFAIGFAQHFKGESGGDMSITNSNSNFGAKSLVSEGFRDSKFIRDDLGFISHIIPPKELSNKTFKLEFNSIDRAKTISVANSGRLYLSDQTNQNILPSSNIEGYRVGGKIDDKINLILNSSGTSTTYQANILMDGGTSSYEKSFSVAKEGDGVTNVISNNVITLTEDHNFINGETVRVSTNTGELPDGIGNEQIYFVITDTVASIGANQIKLATSLNDAENDNPQIIFTKKKSNLKIVSRVSDKVSGDIGHPVQYDSSQNQWYLNVSAGNDIYTILGSYPNSVTPRTFVERVIDNRNYEDTIYKFRYVIPKNAPIKARPPLDGYILQDSTSVPDSDAEVDYQYSPSQTEQTLTSSTQLRYTRFISNASWSGGTATIETELDHNLIIGSEIEVLKVLSSNNTSGTDKLGYNGTFIITAIPSRRKFSYEVAANPGTFIDNTSTRTGALPYYNKKKINGTYIFYRTEKVQDYIQDEQDGIYYISPINSSTKPTVTPFTDLRLSQPIQFLYPQLDRDNPVSDPQSAETFALPDPIGQVVLNNVQNSITRKTLENYISDSRNSIKINDIQSTSGLAHTVYCSTDHGLNPITGLSINDGGLNYGFDAVEQSLFNADLVGGSGEGASVAIRIDTSGTVQSFDIINGGSGYQVGDTLSIVGVATTTGHVAAEVIVSSIYDHVGETIRIDGIVDNQYQEYNTLYRITGVSSTRYFDVTSVDSFNSPFGSGIGIDASSQASVYLTGESRTASTLVYDNILGIATATFADSHGFNALEKVRISGADSSLFNSEFIVSNVIDVTSLEFNVGVSTSSPATTGTIIFHPTGYTSKDGENINSIENRIVETYGGFTTKLTSFVNSTNEILTIPNATESGLRIGDYLQIDNEIVKVKSTINPTTNLTNQVKVFRGLLGTNSAEHANNSVVKKVYPFPVELRRHSILRASGHTFEYVGFGPGNYSNAFPDRQDRQLSNQEELLSQSFKIDGGINVYTGMNNDGDFYIGNKRVSSATGQEDIFDAPIPSVRGENIPLENNNVIVTDEIAINRSIKVDGGNNNTSLSEFNGPVVFNEKVTSNSTDGVEVNSLFIQGDATISQKYTVGIQTPTTAGTTGDVEFAANPKDRGTLGWVYTTSNAWRPFGLVQDEAGVYAGIFTGKFIGDGSDLTNLDSIWTEVAPLPGIAGVSTAFYFNPVGIGTSTMFKTDDEFSVNGNASIKGLLNVTEVIEKATIDNSPIWPPVDPGTGTPLPIDIYLGDNNVYYYTSNSNSNWTINFTGEEVGSTTLSETIDLGESITVAILATNGSSENYNDQVLIDNVDITNNIKWFGGDPPLSGFANSIDSYTYIIIRKANTGNPVDDFTVLASQSSFA